MSDLFEIYEENLNKTLNEISDINKKMQNLSREKTESALKEGHNHIQNAESLLKKLEIEASTSLNKDRLILKMKNFKTEFNKLKDQFNKNQSNYINAKSNEALYLNSDDLNHNNINAYNNNNLMDNEELAYSQGNKLDIATRKCLEIEGRGNEVMRQLEHQTNVMNNVNNNLDDMNFQLGDSNNLIGKMLRRENRNKIVILIAVIFFAIVLIIIATSLTASSSSSIEAPIQQISSNNTSSILNNNSNLR